MRLVILGAGAIGSAIGGLCALAGRDVLLLARGAQLAAIRDGGLTVDRPEGKAVTRCAVADSREPIAWRDGDVVVVATKTQDVAEALSQLAAPSAIPVACATNGLEAERIALRHARDVYAMSLLLPATYLTPGAVQVWSSPVPGAIELGRYPDGSGDHAHAIAGELAAAGFDCEVRTNVMAWKRGKLLANLANGAEALCGPEVRTSALAAAARAEGRACYSAANLSCITEADEAARRATLSSRPIAGAIRSGGSTWQSLSRGRSLETDYLNGEIVLLGRLHGVATPINEGLQRVVTEAARAGAEPGAMTIAELERRVSGNA
ncbi:MAG TPA: 2-dehydropantoate 2-reductase N-terminal domain-containing protein [Kofleriaceae bacterium]|jgi:2-dehydropantoate 2-reductase